MDHNSGNISPGFATKAIHNGQEASQWSSRSIVPPICLSSTFQRLPNEEPKYPYGRLGNPSREILEKSLKTIEEAEYAVTYGSGMAAISAVMHLLEPGQHIIGMNDFYSGTYIYLNEIAPSLKVATTVVDARNPENFRRAIQENTRMIWIETPSNPCFHIVDMEAVSTIARENKIILVVDNSFLTPYFMKPLKLGADIVVHSVGKYLNGHSDVVMGAVITNNEPHHKRLRLFQEILGGIPSPFDCYLVSRSLKTLELRMDRHMTSSLKVAKYLESHPCVERVLHPGLPSHPQYELAKRQSTGFSGILSFYIKNADEKQVMRFFGNLQVVNYAGSFGGYDSVIQSPALWSHAVLKEEERLSVGLTVNLMRLHVGLENVDDIITDLDQALRKSI